MREGSYEGAESAHLEEIKDRIWKEGWGLHTSAAKSMKVRE